MLWPAATLKIDDMCMREVLPKVQQMFSKLHAQRKRGLHLSSCSLDSEDVLLTLAHSNSCSCRAASMWVDTLPTSTALPLSGCAMRHCLGSTHTPVNAPGVQCSYNRYMWHVDSDHAMTCKTLSGGERHAMISYKESCAISQTGQVLHRLWH